MVLRMVPGAGAVRRRLRRSGAEALMVVMVARPPPPLGGGCEIVFAGLEVIRFVHGPK